MDDVLVVQDGLVQVVVLPLSGDLEVSRCHPDEVESRFQEHPLGPGDTGYDSPMPWAASRLAMSVACHPSVK